MLNKMVLFLGAPEQGLTGKIVVFLANLWIFAFFCKQSVEFQFHAFIKWHEFYQVSALRDEANYVVCPRQYALGQWFLTFFFTYLPF